MQLKCVDQVQKSLLGVFLSAVLALAATPSVFAQSDFEVTEASIRDLQLAMTADRLNAVELVDAYLARIDAYDDRGPALNSLLLINPDARAQAAALDLERTEKGPRSPLHGIPVIVKDNYSTDNMATTGASLALAGFVPNDNATQVQRLIDAGAIILAKSNLHEFAYGITTISSLGGQTLNPYDTSRMPGGSSGGTAAAIAASFASVGMGSDTCGSIRIPAAFNNLVGLRPSKGVSSIYGIMPLSSTQDVAGPLARSFADLAVVLDAVSGFDAKDQATSVMQSRPRMGFRRNLGSVDVASLRVGKLMNYYETAEPEVKAQLDRTFERLSAAGATVVEISIPQMNALIASSGLIGHEFEEDINAYLEQFGSEMTLESIVATGLYDPAVEVALTRSAEAEQDPMQYEAAKAARQTLRAAIELAMSESNVSVLAYPPIDTLPAKVGDDQPGNHCSLSANSGLPSLSLPIGFSAGGLPVGLEILGAHFDDAKLLATGYAIEALAPARRAPTSTPPLTNEGF